MMLAAVDAAAALAGLAPGLPLAGARALAPDLETAPHDPRGDAAALARLAAWCEGYSPWTASGGLELGGAAGLALDATGCAHLFGGERALVGALEARLADLGFTARAALAETLGAAWALARFGPAGDPAGDPVGDSAADPAADPAVNPGVDPGGGTARVVPPGGLRAALASLPPAALRLPAETCELLARLGLRRIDDLLALPPAVLVPRFGPLLARRLRQALGAEAEPLSRGAPPPPPRVHRRFAEPIVTPEDLARALAGLSAALCDRLEAAGLGARRLRLTAVTVDGGRQHLCVGTSRPRRDPAPLAYLFRDRLERLDPGFGVEAMTLSATAAEPLAARQASLTERDSAMPGARSGDDVGTAGLPDLIDRLTSRLGADCVHGLAPRASHLPERAVAASPALDVLASLGTSGLRGPSEPSRSWRRGQPRPLRLFDPPQPVEALALLPDHPPQRFRWRRLQHRVVRAEGPERLTGEWWGGEWWGASGGGDEWRQDAAAPAPGEASVPVPVSAGTMADAETRDYFRVEDEDGHRYWLYRSAGRWFLHGLFA